MKGMKLKIRRSAKEIDVVKILKVEYVSNHNGANYLYQMNCKSLITGKDVTVQMTADEVKRSLIA